MACEQNNRPSTTSDNSNLLKLLQQKQLEVKFNLEGTPYKPLENIGTGAYGVVCSALDTRTNRNVAVKKIPNAFAAQTVTKRILREVKILRHFCHNNIIAVLDMIHPGEVNNSDVYIVFDLMETDLHHIIHSKQPLTERHVQYFTYQLLCGLKYVHSANIIHRDLKPSNLMVNANCALKIGDFGMARSLSLNQGKVDHFMTQYVATRWYRAPELLFSMLDYSFGVDVWSVGCILAEMLNRRQLFPGRDHLSQIKLIVSYLGTPSDEVLKAIPSDLVKNIILGFGFKTPLPWKAIVPKTSKSGVDLLSTLLQMAPWRRTNAAEALKHEFLNEFSNSSAEIVCEPFTLSVDVENLDENQLKLAMFEEVQNFRMTVEKASGHHINTEPTSDAVSKTEPVPLDTLPPAQAPKNNWGTGSVRDVEMLSAKMDDVKLHEQVQRDSNPEMEMNPVKAAILRKIISRQENKECEKKTNKKERKRRKSQNTQCKSKECDKPPGLSEQDQTLLERWSKLQEQSKRNKSYAEGDGQARSSLDDDDECLQDELEDIIVNALPSPQDSVKNEKTPNSAQLMEDWIIAANVNPEFLKEIEKHSVRDIAMKSS